MLLICKTRLLMLLLLTVTSLEAMHKHGGQSDGDESHNWKQNNLLTNAISRTAGGVARFINPVFSNARSARVAGLSTAMEGAKEIAVITTDPKPIFPGTRWCGAGSRAQNESEIGLFEGLDSCCRTHDNCPDNILAGESQHGLNNTGSFTRSHCDCDEQFYTCLKDDDSIASNKVGFTYFNVLRPNCFRQDRLIIGCAKSNGYGPTKRCQQYEFSSDSEQIWQWFDAQEF